jgi:hypothetical protein
VHLNIVEWIWKVWRKTKAYDFTLSICEADILLFKPNIEIAFCHLAMDPIRGREEN